MKTTAMIVGIVGAIFVTGTYVMAQSKSSSQKLGAPGAAPESDKNIGPGGTDSTTGSDSNHTNRRSAPPRGKK